MSVLDSFIVDFWARIFGYLKNISIFPYIIKIIKSEKRYKFVEYWALGNLIVSITAVFITLYAPTIISLFIIIYGFLRVFEVFVYQVNVLLFDEYRAKKDGKKYQLKGYRRIVILLLHNYGEIIFWFASSYIYFNIYNTYNILNIIFYSFATTTTFHIPSNITTLTSIAKYIIWAQLTVGLLMTILCIARFISLLPVPETKDEYEK